MATIIPPTRGFMTSPGTAAAKRVPSTTKGRPTRAVHQKTRQSIRSSRT